MRALYTVPLICTAGIALAAGLAVFTDASDYIAALDQTVVENFEAAPIGTVASGTVVDLGILTFSYDGSPDGGPNDIFDGQPLFQFVNNGLDIQFMGEVNFDGTPSGIHYFEFPDPILAFGGTFTGASSGSGLTLSVGSAKDNIFPGIISFQDTLGGDGTGFLGVVSSTPFSTVAFGVEGNDGKSSEVFRLDEVTIGTVSTVPLPPASWALIAALGGLAAVGRGRRGSRHN